MTSVLSTDLPPPPPAATSRTDGSRRQALGSLGVAGLGLLVAVVGLLLSDEDRIGRWGLLPALDPLVGVGVALVTLGFVRSLRAPGAGPRTWTAITAMLVVVAHGAPSVIEREPRFPVAWLHAGFVDYISRTGELLPAVDARFNWPGFFTAATAFTDATGLPQTAVMRWVPAIAELAIVLAVVALARALQFTPRQAAVAGWLYVLFDWVGQAYYAPQTMALLLLLPVLVLALVRLPRAAGRTRLRLWRFGVDLVALPAQAVPAKLARPGLVALLVIVTSVAMSHQLTPVVLVVEVAVLMLVARIRPAVLPWIVALIVVGWICYAARPYWIGHLNDIYGNLGQVGSNVSSGVTERFGGSSQTRTRVLMLRAAFTVGLFVLAALGVLLHYLRTRRLQLLPILLALVPGLLVGAQSYGGEVMLRVFLFCLPGLSMLGALVFVAHDTLRRGAAWALAVLTLAALPVFGFARYGNEQFERVLPGELDALDEVYRVAPVGASIRMVIPSLPWRFRQYESYDYGAIPVRAVADLDPTEIAASLPDNPRGVYLVLNESQFVQLREFYGQDPSIGARLEGLLDGQPWIRRVYGNDVAAIYQVVPGAVRPAEGG